MSRPATMVPVEAMAYLRSRPDLDFPDIKLSFGLMAMDPKTGKPSRVGFKMLDDGRKVRVAKASGEMIDG